VPIAADRNHERRQCHILPVGVLFDSRDTIPVFPAGDGGSIPPGITT